MRFTTVFAMLAAAMDVVAEEAINIKICNGINEAGDYNLNGTPVSNNVRSFTIPSGYRCRFWSYVFPAYVLVGRSWLTCAFSVGPLHAMAAVLAMSRALAATRTATPRSTLSSVTPTRPKVDLGFLNVTCHTLLFTWMVGVVRPVATGRL
ncbi:unnamed protein product [Aspergillus oryzae]|nr:unnamed protein product [Aspergillus oryzae]